MLLTRHQKPIPVFLSFTALLSFSNLLHYALVCSRPVVTWSLWTRQKASADIATDPLCWLWHWSISPMSYCEDSPHVRSIFFLTKKPHTCRSYRLPIWIGERFIRHGVFCTSFLSLYLRQPPMTILQGITTATPAPPLSKPNNSPRPQSSTAAPQQGARATNLALIDPTIEYVRGTTLSFAASIYDTNLRYTIIFSRYQSWDGSIDRTTWIRHVVT